MLRANQNLKITTKFLQNEIVIIVQKERGI